MLKNHVEKTIPKWKTPYIYISICMYIFHENKQTSTQYLPTQWGSRIAFSFCFVRTFAEGQRLGTSQPQCPVESSCFSGRISRGWLVIVGCLEILQTWPFWDGENVTLSMANRDLQLLDQKVTLNHLVCFFFCSPWLVFPNYHHPWKSMLVTPFVKQHHLDVFVNIATKVRSHRMREWSISNCVPLSSIGVSCVVFLLSAYQWFPIIEKSWVMRVSFQASIIHHKHVFKDF